MAVAKLPAVHMVPAVGIQRTSLNAWSLRTLSVTYLCGHGQVWNRLAAENKVGRFPGQMHTPRGSLSDFRGSVKDGDATT